MESELVCQGRRVSREQLLWLGPWIGEHPHWSRKRLSRELCREWDWRNGRGQIKDFAARAFLEKLAARGLVVLPALQLQRSHPRPKPDGVVAVDWPTAPISEPLRELAPLRWILPLAGTLEAKRFDAYVQRYHYLGLRVVGENLKYLVQDKQGRDLACLLFGAAAWRARSRDEFVGWDQTQRGAALHYLANHSRWPVISWARWSGGSARIGSASTDIRFTSWRVLWSGDDFGVRVIGRAIGSAWDRLRGEAGRGPTHSGQPSRSKMFTSFH
jgi:hypothetical protein